MVFSLGAKVVCGALRLLRWLRCQAGGSVASSAALVLLCTACTKPVPPTLHEVLSGGQRQYHVRQCAECHGGGGLGGSSATKHVSLKSYERPASLKKLQQTPARATPRALAVMLRTGLPNHTLLEYGHAYPFLSDEELLSIAFYTAVLIGSLNPQTAAATEWTPAALQALHAELSEER